MALSKYDIEREIEKLKNGTSQKFTIDTTNNDIKNCAIDTWGKHWYKLMSLFNIQ